MISLKGNKKLKTAVFTVVLFCLMPLFLYQSCDETSIEYHSVVLNGNESIQMGPHDSLKILSDGTWCFEIFFTMNTRDYPENRTLFSINDSSQSILSVNTVRDSLSFWYVLAGTDTLFTAEIHIPVWDDVFHLLVLNMNYASRRIDLWIDQERVGNYGNYTTPIPSPGVKSYFLIGENEYDPGSSFWLGLIDECRLWDRDLSDDVILFHRTNPDKLTEHYDHEAGSSGLLALWRFNNETGLIIPDDGLYGIDAFILSQSGTITHSSHHTLPL